MRASQLIFQDTDATDDCSTSSSISNNLCDISNGRSVRIYSTRKSWTKVSQVRSSRRCLDYMFFLPCNVPLLSMYRRLRLQLTILWPVWRWLRNVTTQTIEILAFPTNSVSVIYFYAAIWAWDERGMRKNFMSRHARLDPDHMSFLHRIVSYFWFLTRMFTCSMTADILQFNISSFPFPFSAIIVCCLQLCVFGWGLFLFFLVTNSSCFSQFSPVRLIFPLMLLMLSQSIPRTVALFSNIERFFNCVARGKTRQYWRKKFYGLFWGWQRMD